METITAVRPSPLAGTWYEGEAQRLAADVDAYLDRAQTLPLEGEVVAAIAPHAGHIYSGHVAGHAFAAVRGRRFDLVAVVSPMHHPYNAPLLTTAHQAYGTPLGSIRVDKKALQDLSIQLETRLGYGLTPVAYDREHSLEIELPFLQRALVGEFRLLPVMVRAQSPAISRALGEALAETLHGQNALLVASTDLSHFYSQDEAVKYDTEMLRRIESFDPESVFQAELEEKGFACGLGALTAVMWAARALGGTTVKILRHATSGDVTGDYSSVVGYGAAVILKT